MDTAARLRRGIKQYIEIPIRGYRLFAAAIRGGRVAAVIVGCLLLKTVTV